jgi:hypothetical protein
MTLLYRFPSASKSGSITGLAIDYPRPSGAADGLGMVRRIAGSSVGDMWCPANACGDVGGCGIC